jgi:outer membrane immunogenic protein
MNFRFASAFAATLFATSAFAADLPSRTKAPVAPAMAPSLVQMSFSGFYVGAVAGVGEYTWQDKSVGNLGYKRRSSGGTIGGTVGYNYQMANNVVIGVEGDLSWGSFKKTERYNELAPFGWRDIGSDSSKSDLFGTARVRLGYAINGWIMPYLTGGLAISNSKHYGSWQLLDTTGAVMARDSYSASKSRTGWTAGAGVEALITRNISVKAEYLYADFGTATYTTLCAGCKIKDSLHIGRLGVNYKF